jgi:hypothetical protein
MAKNDVRIVGTGGLDSVPTIRWQTEANSVAIYAGELVKLKSAGSPYALGFVDADITLGTDAQFLGLAKSDSTHTASVDGYVDVYIPHPFIIYEAKAKTGTTVDTQAEIDALCGDRVVIDVTAGIQTVDAAAGDAVGNAMLIIGGDPVAKTLKFMVQTTQNAVNGA